MPCKKPCFVTNCTSNYDKENVCVAFFHPPKMSLNSWKEIIGKPGLSCKSKICSRHFDDEDMVKSREIGGVVYNYQKWRLKSGARPKKYLGNDVNSLASVMPVPLDSTSFPLKQNLQGAGNVGKQTFKSPFRKPKAKFIYGQPVKKIVTESPTTSINSSNIIIDSETVAQESTSPASHTPLHPDSYTVIESETVAQDSTSPPSQTPLHPDSYTVIESETVAQDSTSPPSHTPLHPDSYTDIIRRVKLPSTSWISQFSMPELICFHHSFPSADDRKIVIKTMSVASMNTVKLFLNGNPISPTHIPTQFNAVEDLSNIIAAFDVSNVCDGIEQSSLKDVHVTSRCSGVKNGNIWRSRRCEFVTESNLCLNCKSLKKYLISRKKESRTITRDSCVKKKQQRKKNMAFQRIVRQGKVVAEIVSNLRKDNSTLALTNKKLMLAKRRTNFEEILKSLTPTEQIIVKTMINKANAKPGINNRKNGMLYDPLFLMYCLQLRLKSSKTYRHMKAHGILPLPSLETIRKLLSSSDCRFGTNRLALEHIKIQLQGLPEEDQYGSVSCDEIHVKKGLTFDTRKMEFNGLNDFGDESDEFGVEPGLADHVLVFMFRPYKFNWHYSMTMGSVTQGRVMRKVTL